MRLLSNSTRGLRKRTAQMFFETIDVRGHIFWQREFGREVITGTVLHREVETLYRSYLLEETRALRLDIARLPANPSARKSDRQLGRKTRAARMSRSMELRTKTKNVDYLFKPEAAALVGATEGQAKGRIGCHRDIS